MAIPVTLSTEQEEAISKDISSERLINCFPTIRPNNQVSQLQLIGSHGSVVFSNGVGSNPSRALRANDDGTEGYAVFNDKFYTVSTGGVLTQRGTIGTSSGNAYIAVGHSYVMVTDEQKGYYYEISTTTFAEITDSDFVTNPRNCDYVDGFFLVIGVKNGQFAIAASDPNDATSWPATDFVTPSVFIGALKGFCVINGYLWLTGNAFSEIRTYVGTPNQFPYDRLSVIEYGGPSPNSMATIGDTAYWIGNGREGKAYLMSATSSSIQIIESEDINNTLQQFTTIQDIIGFTYSDGGQHFYQFTSPTMNQTWVYCITTKHFFKKQLNNGDRDFANTYMFLGNKHIVGSRSDGKLYQMTLDSNVEADTDLPVKRQIVLPTLYSEDKYIRTSLIRIIMDLSEFSTNKYDPTLVGLEVSRDGGFTYGDQILNVTSFQEGYIQYSRIGAGRRLTFRLTIDEPVKFILVAFMIYATVEGR